MSFHRRLPGAWASGFRQSAIPFNSGRKEEQQTFCRRRASVNRKNLWRVRATLRWWEVQMKHLKLEAKFEAMFERRRTPLLLSRRVLPLLAVLAGLSAPAGAAPSARDSLPDGTRRMTPAELYMLYHDKSWQWADGAGRMESRNRRFTARVDGEKGKAWAEGRWRITWSG